MAIRPKTYEEVMQFKRCLVLKNCIQEMDDELMEKAYHFTCANPENRVAVVDDILYFTDYAGTVVLTKALEVSLASQYTRLELVGPQLLIGRPYVAGTGSGDGGSSGNNNNNNNNNNG